MGALNGNKICVILGAGASFDVRTPGSRVMNEECRPPLANSLFDALNDATWQSLQTYSGARFLRARLELDSARAIGLEEALLGYANHESEPIRQRFKHIPPYIRDLLFQCSETYIRDPDGYIQLVTELLAEHSFEVLFLTLNYDTLLEKALTLFDPDYEFQELPYYISPARTAKVVKLHGSINWFIGFPEGSESWQYYVDHLDLSEKPNDSDVVVLNSVHKINDYRSNNRWWYPVLTAPLAGKGLADAVCPAEHIDFVREFLASAGKILVVGTSGQDQDLLGLLDESMAESLKPMVHFVGAGDSLTEESLARFKQAVGAFRNNPLVTTHYGGFQNYVAGTNFRRFVE